MADATRTTRTVERTVAIDEDVVTLTMTVDEAAVLRALCSAVRGDLTDSPRKHSYAVWRALRAAGVSFSDAFETGKLVSGHIDFANYPNEDNNG